MRFSFLLLASALSLAPIAAQAEVCPKVITPELEATFGEVVAWPDAGQTVHAVQGLVVFEQPVAYVLAKRSAEGEPIESLNYRLQGLFRKVGQPHLKSLRNAFDAEFKGADCGESTQSTCGVLYDKVFGVGSFNGAEIGSGELWISDDARGPQLSLVEADFDLPDSDPVFVVCFYNTED